MNRKEAAVTVCTTNERRERIMRTPMKFRTDSGKAILYL
jgi:hypothetical protein